MEGSEERKKSRFPFGCALVSLLVLTAVMAIVIPEFHRPHGSSGESSSIGTLKSICTGLEQFKSGTCVDLNANGIGEFGFLEELGGAKPVRTMSKDGKTVTSEGAIFAQSPYIPMVLGKTASFSHGTQFRATKGGYHFILYLPTGKKSATSTHGSGVDVDLAEQCFIAYAWPVEAGRSGVRAFVIDPLGQPYSMANTGPNPYSGDNAPPWDAALKESSWDSYIDDGGKGQAGKENWTPTG